LTGTINATINGSEIVKGTIVELENSSVLALRIPNTGQNTSWKIGAISFNNISNPFLINILSNTNLNAEALDEDGDVYEKPVFLPNLQFKIQSSSQRFFQTWLLKTLMVKTTFLSVCHIYQ